MSKPGRSSVAAAANAGRLRRHTGPPALVEVNEQLLLSTLRAWTEAETTTRTADEVARSAERKVEAERLASATLAQLNLTLEARVEERTRELVLARDEALAGTRSKERFLSNMSHEIRTPMFGMLGALELLAQTELTPGQLGYLSVASASGEALLGIINEVLDFAKIGAGQLQQAHEPIDVQAIAQSVVTLFSAAAQSRSIELHLDADPALAPARMGDSLHLRQVLMNLVGNAIKFAPLGRVVLGVHPVGDPDESDRVRFEVSDSGFGIDLAQQEKIFEPFAQVDQPGQAAPGGTGLGLTISRELVHAMGGALGVVSSPGQGSTFGFDLTLVRAPRLRALPPGAPLAPAGAEPNNHRVLLVEDNPVNQMICSAMLESMGLEVVVAEDGSVALNHLAKGSFAAVLMDCQMPVMDGYEATRRLREIERLHGAGHTPVIAMTANAFISDVERCLASGMDAHLAKPFKKERLQTILAQWVPGRDAISSPRSPPEAPGA